MAGNIYVTGDVHGDNSISKLSTKNWPIGKTLDRDDYLIIVGDVAILWENVINNHERYLKNWYGKTKPWTTLYIDGNHENHKRLNDLPTTKMFGDEVGVVSDNIYHLKRGRVYNIHGSTFFTMGGATSTDKYRRTMDIDWWEEEVPSYDEYNLGIDTLEAKNWEVDYVLTHTMPSQIFSMFGFSMDYGDRMSCPVAKYLDNIAMGLKYKGWYFGHFHDDIDRGKFHLMYDRIEKIN
jgi:hypothetical protein